MNWINSWNAGNKKEVYELSLRLGTWTLFEFRLCPCARLGTWTLFEFRLCPCATCTTKNCSRLRFMILNFGFEI